MDGRRSLVRRAIRLADVLEQFFEASLAYFFQLAAFGPKCRFGVVIDRDAQLFPQPRAERMGKLNTDAHREIGKGNEGHNVSGAHAWMLTAMMSQVDPFGGDVSPGHRRIDHEARLGDEGDHHPVVRGISLHVDHAGARGLDRIRDLGDHLQSAPLGEVGDALYEGCQTTPPATVLMTRFTPT
jgi:hypothetical protein